MNSMQGVTNTAAQANLLTGQNFERLPYNARVRFLVTGDAAGLARATIFIGGRLVMQESSISRANRVPIVPDDVLVTSLGRRGDQVTIAARSTGAAVDFFWRVELKPL